MEQTLSRNGLSILMGLTLIFGLRWMSQHWFNGGSDVIRSSSYSYEMPRPKSYTGGFDLSGREIDREVLSDEEILAKATDPKAVEAAKKAMDAKKNVPMKPTMANQKQHKLDHAKLSVNTTDTSRHSSMSTSEEESSYKKTTEISNGAIAQVSAPAVAPANNQNNQDQNKRTAAEWLSLLTTHSTMQLIGEFESAHAQGDVSDADFYSIAFQFFNSSSQQNQQTGTEILTNDNSQSGFLYISQQYAKASTTNQATLWTLMLTFAQSTKFTGLNRALSTNNSTVIPLALKVLAVAVQKAQQQVTSQGGVARGVAGTIQPSALKLFLVDLSQIAKAGGSNASEAQSLLSQIQALNP